VIPRGRRDQCQWAWAWDSAGMIGRCTLFNLLLMDLYLCIPNARAADAMDFAGLVSESAHQGRCVVSYGIIACATATIRIVVHKLHAQPTPTLGRCAERAARRDYGATDDPEAWFSHNDVSLVAQEYGRI
jgi:hypothetical protein